MLNNAKNTLFGKLSMVAGAVVLTAAASMSAVANSPAPAPAFQTTEAGCLDVFAKTERALHSNEYHNLCELTKDRVVMVVNTASRCGFTGQFEDLENLYREYAEQGLVILGFPSSSFRQEHADEADTAEVCFANFGVTFPMMATTPVRGGDAHEVFKSLHVASGAAPRWNFHKYVVAADGSQVASFGSSTSPSDAAVTSVIEQYLGAK